MFEYDDVIMCDFQHGLSMRAVRPKSQDRLIISRNRTRTALSEVVSPGRNSMENSNSTSGHHSNSTSNPGRTRPENRHCPRQIPGPIRKKPSSKCSSRAATPKKPSYKHVPHSEKPAHLVARRNERERKRVQAVNSAFLQLRTHVPHEPRHKRLSKFKTLQVAIQYIRHLQDTIRSHDHVNNNKMATTAKQQQQRAKHGGHGLGPPLPHPHDTPCSRTTHHEDYNNTPMASSYRQPSHDASPIYDDIGFRSAGNETSCGRPRHCGSTDRGRCCVSHYDNGPSLRHGESRTARDAQAFDRSQVISMAQWPHQPRDQSHQPRDNTTPHADIYQTFPERMFYSDRNQQSFRHTRFHEDVIDVFLE